MSATLVPFDPHPGRERLLELVDALRARVEAGECIAFALAEVNIDGMTRAGWEATDGLNVHLLAGSVAHMEYRLHAEGIGVAIP